MSDPTPDPFHKPDIERPWDEDEDEDEED